LARKQLPFVKESAMLTVSETAGAYLATMLTEAETPAEKEVAMRIYLRDGHLAMNLDEPRTQDAKFDHQGVTVLVIEEELAQELDGKTLDVGSDEKGTGLVVSS
jgi:Fe-S cluster assembly iron-binding protein IscA